MAKERAPAAANRASSPAFFDIDQPCFKCATCSFVTTALEDLMRATLGALANFNEDERMILVK